MKRTQAQKFFNALQVEKTPDTKSRKYAARSKGKRFKLGICRFWAALFEVNEHAPKRNKMTDEEIKRQVILEYPDRPSVKKLGPIGECGEVTVNTYRQWYNQGRLTSGVRPEVPSKRYGLKGEEVDPRTGKPLDRMVKTPRRSRQKKHRDRRES